MSQRACAGDGVERVSTQGQVFQLTARRPGGEPLWAYRYRIGGRDSERVQRGGFASEQDARDARTWDTFPSRVSSASSACRSADSCNPAACRRRDRVRSAQTPPGQNSLGRPVLAGGGKSVPQIRHGRVSGVMGFRSLFRIAKLSSLNPAGAMFSSRSAIYAPFIGECFG
jgi:hypothetical protein